jgi:predicted DNA binding protein
MYKAKIFASHDCWASRISTLFPEEHMSLNNTTWIEDRHALDVFAIRAQTDKNFDAIVAYIKKEKTIKKWAIMEKERTYMIIQVDTYSPQPLIRHVYEYNCFQLAPTILKDGGEYWTIGAPTRDPITRVFSIMKKVGKARLRYITPSCFEALSRFPVI